MPPEGQRKRAGQKRFTEVFSQKGTIFYYAPG
jgi:hypothetical protein